MKKHFLFQVTFKRKTSQPENNFASKRDAQAWQGLCASTKAAGRTHHFPFQSCKGKMTENNRFARHLRSQDQFHS